MNKDRVERMRISAKKAAKDPLWRQALEKYTKVNRTVADLCRRGGISPEETEKYQREATTTESTLRLASQHKKAEES